MTERDPRLVLQDAVMDAPVHCKWKVTLLALLRFTSRDWTTTSSRPTLARLAGLQEHTVRDVLAVLVQRGGLQREDRHRDDGGLTSPRWTIVPDRIVAAMVEADAEREKREPPRVQRRTQGTLTTPPPGYTDDPTLGTNTTPPRGREHTHPGVVNDPTPGVVNARRSGEGDLGTLPGEETRGEEPVSTRPRAHELVLVEAEVVELPAKRSRKQTATVEVTPLSTVWTLYRRWHPRAGKQPPRSWGIHHAIAAHGEEAVCALVEWAHESDHQRAQYLRDNDYLGATLFRPGKLPEYIAWAMEWVESGRASQMSEAEKKKRDPFGIHRAAYGGGGKQLTEDDFPF